MRVEFAGDVVVKWAESEEERLRLGAEAAVLRALAHPGVVRLVGSEGGAERERADRLVLHRVVGPTLEGRSGQPAGVAAGWAAAVATVLADIHELGYAHGDVRAEHVIIDEHGRPVLCGFGSARRVDDSDAKAAFRSDVSALARLGLEHLSADEPTLRRLLARWEEGTVRRSHDAGSMARSLVDRVPDAHVGARRAGPDGTGPGADRSGPAGPWPALASPARAWPGPWSAGRAAAGLGRRAGALAAAAVATVVIAGLLFRQFVPVAPQVRGAPLPAYVLRSDTGENPLVVLGRWGCGALRPAVLDQRSGSVWVFQDWPSRGSQVAATFLRQVPSAVGVGVRATNPGCDELVVLESDGREMAVPVPIRR